MPIYTHLVRVFHTLRRGALAGVTVPCEFRVCSLADAERAVADLRRGLDVVEAHILPLEA